MKVNWWEFHSLFPNYYDFKTPVWSDYKITGKEFTLDVVAPGYEKEDFDLYEEGGRLLLSIKRDGDESPLVYSILGRYGGPEYDMTKAIAKYKAGILKISIPKRQEKEMKALVNRIGIS